MRSLRTRLVLISTLVSGLVIVGLGLVSWQLMMRVMRESVDLRLEGVGSRLIQHIRPNADEARLLEEFKVSYEDELAKGNLVLNAQDFFDGGHTLASIGWSEAIKNTLPETFPEQDSDPIRHPRPEFGGPGMEAGMPPPDDRPPGGPHGEPPIGPGDRLIEFTDATINGQQWRFIAVQERGIGLLAGLNFTQANPGLILLRRGMFFGIPFALCLVGLGGWIVADRALRPLRRISDTAQRISVEALNERMPEEPHSDPEIVKLTSVLNAMMQRLEVSFVHVNRFSADVSHELKTPIAVMQGEIESSLRECAPGSAEESAFVVLRIELSRLKSIISSLLMLSQADVGKLIIKNEPFSLSGELDALAEDAEILCDIVSVNFDAEIETGLAGSGNAILLRQALMNLISNGVKFNTQEGYLRLLATRSGDFTEIVVENSGQGISEENLEKIFDRFFRGDRSRSRGIDGFGLGLSLARVIVESHRGTLILEDASPERTRFVVRLPQ